MIKAKTIKSKNQLVIPLGNAWAVKSEGSLKFSFITDTKKEALDYAKVIAANNNTDWWDQLTQTGFINENNLSMTQGTNKLKTFANLTYSNNEGYIKTNSYERLSARLNVDYKILKNLKVALTSGYNRGVNKRVPAAWDGG